MARRQDTWWQRNKFKLNALVLILPVWFLYQSLNPQFPAAWQTKQLGDYELTPMPFNKDGPYFHHDMYVKDFLLTFSKGEVSSIRQAYLNIGERALPLAELQQGEGGILHGTRHGQHVHAIAKPTLTADDKMWLTVQNWQGDTWVTSWDLPEGLVQ